MQYDKPNAEALSSAMSEIDGALGEGIHAALPKLPPLRLRVMKALNVYVKDLERYCANLDHGSSDEKAASTAIRLEIIHLMKTVSDHVARWTPNAIAADAKGYEFSSNNLQRSLKALMKRAAM